MSEIEPDNFEDLENADLEIRLPLAFAVGGTPVSHQGNRKSKNRWKERVYGAARQSVPEHCWAIEKQLSILIYDFPEEDPAGDVDNIVKLIQDALTPHIISDDVLIRRVVAQRFLPRDLEAYRELPDIVAEASIHDAPFVYVRITENPLEEAQ